VDAAALREDGLVVRTKDTNDENRLSGRTLRWCFDQGPTAGTTFEHHFYADGTVVYRVVDGSDDDKQGKKMEEAERPKYKAFEIADDVVVASYLAGNGYALTVALNFADGRVVGFASNDKEWFPLEGTFEEVKEARAASEAEAAY
jgi:hypothetical protein